MHTTTRARVAHAEQRTLEILSRLDDHLLRDIGIARTGIPHAARAAAHGGSARRRGASLAVAAILTAASFLLPEPAAAANSNIYCEGYATDAVRRHRDYTRKQCGDLVNLVWNADFATHYAYCKRVDLGTAEWVRSLRYNVLLNECATPKPAVAR
jgi:hypothetical protein